MSEKKKGKFSKAVVIYCLVVSTVVTAVVLWICLHAGYIGADTVGVLLGLWGGELLLLCVKRLLADKTKMPAGDKPDGKKTEEASI